MLQKMKPAAFGARRASVFVDERHVSGPEHKRSQKFQQVPIRSELIGSDTCTALGVTAQGATPVLQLCRKLIEAGHDPAAAVHVFRGEVLALLVRSVGEAAGLEVNNKGTGFVPFRPVRAASPIRQNRRGTS
jgi:hypothetical protein